MKFDFVKIKDKIRKVVSSKGLRMYIIQIGRKNDNDLELQSTNFS